jgi:hypothetical protein
MAAGKREPYQLFRHFLRGRSGAVPVRRVFVENHPAKEKYGKKSLVPPPASGLCVPFCAKRGRDENHSSV